MKRKTSKTPARNKQHLMRDAVLRHYSRIPELWTREEPGSHFPTYTCPHCAGLLLALGEFRVSERRGHKELSLNLHPDRCFEDGKEIGCMCGAEVTLIVPLEGYSVPYLRCPTDPRFQRRTNKESATDV